MNITAINDADRERHFDNFNDKLLKRVRAIKQNKSYENTRNDRRVKKMDA